MEDQSLKPCRLLQVPREIRYLIYKEIFTHHVLHVSGNRPLGLRTDPRDKRFSFHACLSPNPFATTACPMGQGDHNNCRIGIHSHVNFAILATCKEINEELQKWNLMTKFFADNAFQFDNLEFAGSFLFGFGCLYKIKEHQRASIQHLRFALPYDLTRLDETIYMPNQEPTAFAWNSWRAINNYFSIPWDRNTLKLPDATHVTESCSLSFVYGQCSDTVSRDAWIARFVKYREQLHTRDTTYYYKVNIGGLKMKEMPRIEFSMKVPLDADLEKPAPELFTSLNQMNENSEAHGFRGFVGLSLAYMAQDWSEEIRSRLRSRHNLWLQPLLQFRQYNDLEFTFYDENGIRKDAKLLYFAEDLKSKIAGPIIGPQRCVFFRED